ncbi:primosomal protein N' [Desulfonema ishimotonii]|uniref:Replication restart protein PriA n=1 Tax=Desulfonema ishimotonii TaxID=45657 RepID=A0A401G237_9BACT|nr:primosomal protein N' [Desulfonema ishimotonii]GBC63284.1 primosomal protein N' [Desulfonema ishimotonii]
MTTPSQYIEVAIALPVDKTFTYAATPPLSHLICPGKRVLVPFRRRRVTGYVLGPAPPPRDYTAKAVLDVPDPSPLFPVEMIRFFRWVADYYLYPLGEVIRCALPGGLNRSDIETLSLTDAGRGACTSAILTPPEQEILRYLGKGPCKPGSLRRHMGSAMPAALLRMFERRGWVARERIAGRDQARQRTERYVAPGDGEMAGDSVSAPRKKILSVLRERGEVPLRALKEQVPTAAGLVRAMAQAGQVILSEKPVYRDPFGEPIRPDTPPKLTPEQAGIIGTVLENLDGGFSAWLLAGVTGSGKTEVYMRLARAVTDRDLPVVVLVPEIALISQMERRFRARFGEQVAVLHSGLSAGERYDQWLRILNGEARIIIGARSAIFAPCRRIGMIIVDEEHDTSYKQGADLLYNARDLAVVRARQLGGVALLGSATPSVQSFYNVKIRKFRELRLTRRVEKRPLPHISVVDLRQHRDVRGARRFITPPLHQAMKTALERREQVLIFLNRRGFASFPVCADCGAAVRCNHCDITLTLHRLASAYKCHYCGFTRPAPGACSACGSPNIKLLGMGTEKVEKAVNALFPEARVARMDRDTTTRKGSILKILKGLKNGAIDVLIGTQMVAKGHDFPNITVVGIICADLSLSMPDFRAGERTFQLLAQVAGRAGRGDVPGQVILQTYMPDHFSIMAARAQDFRAFYKTEIGFRKALGYPPESRLIQIRISGKDEEKTGDAARTLGLFCRDLRGRDTVYAAVEVLGPIESPISRIEDRYRWQMLLKGRNVSALRRFTRQMVSENAALFSHPKISVIVDVDPFFMS